MSFAILALSVAFILTALFTGEQQVSSGNIIEPRIFASPNSQLPAISATLNCTFTARGSLSAQNPVEVIIRITNANVSNLLDYYQAVGFLGAVFNGVLPSPPSNASGPTATPEVLPQNQTYGFVHFEGEPDGSYTGAAQLVWQSQTEVHAFLIPQSWYPWKLNAGPSSGESPVINIASAAETFTWQYQESSTRLALVAVGFGVLLFQPVLEFAFRQMDKKKAAGLA